MVRDRGVRGGDGVRDRAVRGGARRHGSRFMLIDRWVRLKLRLKLVLSLKLQRRVEVSCRSSLSFCEERGGVRRCGGDRERRKESGGLGRGTRAGLFPECRRRPTGLSLSLSLSLHFSLSVSISVSLCRSSNCTGERMTRGH